MTEGIPDQRKCLNCNTSLSSKNRYCPNCGQKKMEEKDFRVRHLVFDSFADYFHFDSKFFRTVKLLIIKPGRMTVEYLEGKRARFLQPFKLLLFISVVYFLLISLERGNKQASAPLDAKEDTSVSINNSDKPELAFTWNTDIGKRKIPADSLNMAIKRKGIDAVIDSLYPGASWLERALAKRSAMSIAENPGYFMEKMVHNASRVVFLLIPLMALLLKLLYFRAKKMYYNHLIFAIHFHAVVFLTLILYEIMKRLSLHLDIMYFLLGLLVYLYLSMKRVYLQKYARTLMNFLALVFGYMIIALPLFFIVLALISIFV